MSRRRTILVVESNPLLREYLRRLLNSSFPHMDLALVADTREALARVTGHPPDFILVNLLPGGGRSFGAIRELRCRVADARLAVLSGHDLPEYREEAFRRGADHYLEKATVRSEDIVGLVRSAGGSGASA